ncbi:MAG: peptidoglycan-binding protein [Pseudomonadota bacterium]
MLKYTLTSVLTLSVLSPSFAQSAPALEGDEGFMLETADGTPTGDNFSYAGQWGNGQPWSGDGKMQTPEPAAPLPIQRPSVAQTQSGLVSSLRRGRVVQTAPQAGVQSNLGQISVGQQRQPAPQAQQRQGQPVTRTLPQTTPQPRTVNTVRTVSAPVQHPKMMRPARSSTGLSTAPLAALPQARPGECFARMQIPAQYETQPKKVSVAQGYERARVMQAEFATDFEEIIVKDAHTRYVVRQPKFAVQQQQVMLRPSYDRLEVVPARFSYSREKVQVSEPRLVWKRGIGLSGISRTDPRTGETWCLVEEPGRTITINKRVVTQPEQVRRVPVPAQTVSVARQVLIDEGGVEKVSVPAQTRRMTVQRLVAPGRVDTFNAPEEFDTVEQRILTAPERFEWVSVLCDTNAGPNTIKSLQQALASRGLYRGSIDGIMGPRTRKALVEFQRGAGLPHAGYLTTDTMAALGVRY